MTSRFSSATHHTDFSSRLPWIWTLYKQLKIEHASSPQSSQVIVVPVRYERSHWQVLSTHVPQKELEDILQSLIWQEGRGCREVIHQGKNYVLLPLPSTPDIPRSRLSRQWGIDAATHLQSIVSQKASITFAHAEEISLPHVVNGWMNGLYGISGYKVSVKKAPKPQEIKLQSLILLGENALPEAQEQFHLAKAQCITRHLGDTPSNYLTPQAFAEATQFCAQEFGFTLEVYDEARLEELKMHSLLSVAQGSPNPPVMLVITVKGTDASSEEKPVLYVGKGVTFDSGGISLKPAANMHEMKYDMLGGGTVLGAMCHLSSQPPTHDSIALIGCVENMPGHHATRPGDVVTAYGGKSIEILNTDAEGRLVMADLFGYAQKHFSPRWIIDAATLTGACLYALGSVGAGMMSTDPAFAAFLKQAANTLGEPVWELPLWKDLHKALDSQVADVKNISASSVKAGTITAGIFLSHFIHKNTPWAHFDIAGVGWNIQAGGYVRKGASGYGVELLAYASQHSKTLK